MTFTSKFSCQSVKNSDLLSTLLFFQLFLYLNKMYSISDIYFWNENSVQKPISVRCKIVYITFSYFITRRCKSCVNMTFFSFQKELFFPKRIQNYFSWFEKKRLYDFSFTTFSFAKIEKNDGRNPLWTEFHFLTSPPENTQIAEKAHQLSRLV